MTYIPPMRRSHRYDYSKDVDMNGDRETTIKNMRADMAFQAALEREGATRGVVTTSSALSPRRYTPMHDTYIRSNADF